MRSSRSTSTFGASPRRASRWAPAAAIALTALTAPVAPVSMSADVPHASALNSVLVTTTSDTTDAADGLVSLREAFTIANTDGDDTEITLVADEVYRLCDGAGSPTDEDANADGDLDHTAADSLVIDGNGAEIRNQCGGERVLHAVDADGTIELHDLQISGGDLSVGEQGSGLLAHGDVVIMSSTFTDNTGANAVELGEMGSSVSLVVADSVFSDNRGGVRINSGTATITGSDFVFNQAPGITANASSLTATEVFVRENAGGGINGIDGAVTVLDSEVRDNGGVGIRNTGNNDTGQPLTVANTLVDHNANGGVQCSYCTDLTITGSTITGSVPANGFGGSGVSFIQNLDGPTVTISATTISGNTATEHGGGVLIDADGVVADVTIDASTITGNRAGLFGDGGGIHATSADVTITGSHVDGNDAKPEGILVGGSGGGVAMAGGGTLTVVGSTIDGNLADDGGGGVSLFDIPNASFSATSIAGNSADGFGGGGFEAAGDGASYTFVETTVHGNSAHLAGGGLDVANDTSGVEVLIDRSTISDNTTTTSNGGGIFTNTSLADVTVRNSTITGNSASSIGGGLAVLTSGTVTLEQATVVDNSAPTAANVYHQTGTLTSFGSVIALAQGGGDDCDTFSGATVSQGYSFSGADTCGFGGGAGDQAAGGDPTLGPLAVVGGPTAVRVPLGGSPLVSAIPLDACSFVVDQNGAPRPLGAGCEIGSVELVTGGVVAVADFATVPAGRRAPTVLQVLANDYDPGVVLRPATLRIVEQPEHGHAVAISRGRVLYRPDRGFVGTDTFTYEVCARGVGHRTRLCVSAVVTVVVG